VTIAYGSIRHFRRFEDTCNKFESSSNFAPMLDDTAKNVRDDTDDFTDTERLIIGTVHANTPRQSAASFDIPDICLCKIHSGQAKLTQDAYSRPTSPLSHEAMMVTNSDCKLDLVTSRRSCDYAEFTK
jgi:hypothetical protein